MSGGFASVSGKRPVVVYTVFQLGNVTLKNSACIEYQTSIDGEDHLTINEENPKLTAS